MQCDIITWTAALTASAAAMAWGMTLTLLTRTDSGNGEQPIFHMKASSKDHQLRNVFLHHLHDHFCNDDNHNHNSTNDNDYNNNKSISSSINKLRKTSSSFLTATVLKVMQTPIKMIIKQLKPQSTATVHGCIEPSQHVFVVFFFWWVTTGWWKWVHYLGHNFLRACTQTEGCCMKVLCQKI